MKTIELPLINAGAQTPSALTRAESVITLMSQSTNDVLNTSDQLVESLEKLEKIMGSEDFKGEKLTDYLKQELPVMKSGMFNIYFFPVLPGCCAAEDGGPYR